MAKFVFSKSVTLEYILNFQEVDDYEHGDITKSKIHMEMDYYKLDFTGGPFKEYFSSKYEEDGLKGHIETLTVSRFGTELVRIHNLDLDIMHFAGAGPKPRSGVMAEQLFKGHDRLIGVAGNDELHGYGGNDTILAGAGDDYLTGDRGNDWLVGGQGNDDMDGGNGNDDLTGGLGDDQISGGGGHDRMTGGRGHDLISGGAGNDRIVGGLGLDELEGGAGADRFVFESAKDSAPGSDACDTIAGFRSGVDHIDLKMIDADTGHAGNQAFTFIGKAEFSHDAGEVRFDEDVLQADTNGDGISDFDVYLGVYGSVKLAATDLVL